jgi:phytoene dehydrogenase-like protein
VRSVANGAPADFDAIVIGAGINGLVCATLLAQAKRRVVIVEARDRPGGVCMTAEVIDGFRVSSLAHLTGPFDAGVAKLLKLQKFGLTWSETAMPTIALSPDARHLVLGRDARATSQTIAVHSAADAQAWSNFDQRMSKTTKALSRWMRSAPGPARPQAKGRGGFFAAPPSAKAEGLDRATAVLLDLSIADFLDQHFESPALKGALAFDAVLGSGLGPRSPGTAFSYAMRRALDDGTGDGFAHPQGGLGAFAAALLKGAEAAGARTRLKARVTRILIENSRTMGVELEGGEIVYAPSVVSSLDPKTTLLSLGGPRHLPFGLKRRLKGLHVEGVTAKVNLALKGLPAFKGLQREDLRGRMIVCPSVDYLDRAFAAAGQGTFSPEPAMEITIPTLHDSLLAPINEHVLSAHVLYAPHKLAGASWDQAKNDLVQRVIAVLQNYAPDLSSRILAGDVFSPPDIEKISGASGGHWHGGDLTLDRLGPLRPAAGVARYETPVPGLYLCGSGTHPCGGVTGINGRNAAEAVLATVPLPVQAP